MDRWATVNTSASRASSSGSSCSSRGSTFTKLKLPKADLLRRSLTFVDATTEQVVKAVVAQDEQLGLDEAPLPAPFRARFWYTVLTKERYSHSCFPARDLQFWVSAFNQWARDRKASKQIAKSYDVSLESLKGLLGISSKDACKMGCLLRPELQKPFSITERWLKETTVSFLFALIGGVLLSPKTTTEGKLRFIFALFDLDDSEELSQTEFEMSWRTLYLAISRIFRVSGHDEVTAEAINGWATVIFDTIASWDHDKQMNVLTYRDLHSFIFSGDSVYAVPWKLLLMRFSAERDGNVISEAFDDRVGTFVLSFKEPQDMDLRRTCPQGHVLYKDCHFLSREDCIAVKTVFFYVVVRDHGDPSERAWFTCDNAPPVSIAALVETAEDGLVDVPDLARNNIARVLRRKKGDGKLDLVEFLKVLSPCSTERHLEMYMSWCRLHDRFMEAETDVQSFSGYQAQLEEYLNLPLLPRNEQDQILRLFEKADIEGRGHLFIDELVANQIVPDDLADAVLKLHDLNNDAVIDKEEFLLMMCPCEYRVLDFTTSKHHHAGPAFVGKAKPVTASEATKYFRTFIASQHQTAAATVKKHGHRKTETSYALAQVTNSGARGSLDATDTPIAMRKKPPHGKVQRWSATFHALDRNGDGKIDRTELVRLLGTEMASTLLRELRDVADNAGDYVAPSFEELEHRRNISTPTRPANDAGDDDGSVHITERAFVNALSWAHGYRPPDPNDGPDLSSLAVPAGSVVHITEFGMQTGASFAAAKKSVEHQRTKR
jgi:hypothetical protein